MKHTTLCLVAVHCSLLAACGDMMLLKRDLISPPSLHTYGIQFDSKTVFGIDPSKTGPGRFVTTQDGGRTWHLLWIAQNEQSLEKYDDVSILFFNGSVVRARIRGEMHCSDGGPELALCNRVRSVSFRGIEGLGLEHDGESPPHLIVTTNGGLRWSRLLDSRPWFNHITTFDKVENRIIIAAVSKYTSDGRSEHRLAKTADGGVTWTELPSPKEVPGIWATHLFFLSESCGWISSDRDEGLFYTTNGGQSWTKINVPERCVKAMFFKNPTEGRLIGTVDERIYETSNGGQTWKALNEEYVAEPSFQEYFKGTALSKWNDFAVRQTVQRSRLAR